MTIPEPQITDETDVIELSIRLRSGRFESRLELPLRSSPEEKEQGLEMWGDMVAAGFKYGVTSGEMRAPIKKDGQS